jgi:hypothetical protein
MFMAGKMAKLLLVQHGGIGFDEGFLANFLFTIGTISATLLRATWS